MTGTTSISRKNLNIESRIGFLTSVNWYIGAVEIEEKKNVNSEYLRDGEEL